MSMRKHARAIAKAAMQKQGYTGINKKRVCKDSDGNRVVESFFSKNWKKFYKQAMAPKTQKVGKKSRPRKSIT